MTVSGERPAESLGLVLPHEHVMVDFVGADKVARDRYDADEVFEAVLPHLLRVRRLGCRTLVECTPAYLGRDPLLLKRLSKASGLLILTNTGFYGAAGDKFLPRFVLDETAEKLADRWAAEWKSGIEGTGVRPGFIKIGVDPELSDVDRKLVKAAGLAHLRTGLTIASHTGPGRAAEAQIKVLGELGVQPSAFVWVHAQSEADTDLQTRLAKLGAWVEFDGLSPNSVDQHVRLVQGMQKAGCLDQTLVSHDAGWYNVGEKGGGKFRPFDVLFAEFLPALRKLGLDDKAIRQITETNPQRAFARSVRAI